MAVRVLCGRPQLALRQHGVVGFCAHKYGMVAIAACSHDAFMEDKLFCHSELFLERMGKGCVSRDMAALWFNQ